MYADGEVSWVWASVLKLGIALLIFIVSLTFFTRNNNNPPCYSGWIPWLGCALEFGKAPLYFIEASRKKLGPVFTLKVAGKRLTFVTEVEDFKHFFESDNVDFQRAVQSAVQHTASISKESFLQYHTNVHDMMKGRLAGNRLLPFCQSLCDKFTDGLEKLGKSGKCDLNKTVRHIMYVSVLDNLFGEKVLPTDSEEAMTELEDKFVQFDDKFEYGSQLPEFLVGTWAKSKWWLLSLFDTVVKRQTQQSTKPENPTVLDSLIQSVDRQHAPNYALLMMWASLANAIPMTFWTLSFILSNADIYQQIMTEIDAVLGHPENKNLQITEAELQKIPTVKQCVLEAIRLRSPGVISRGVAKPFQIRGYTVPAGDMLMLSPYWAHRNPQLFPDPHKFQPDRWATDDMEKTVFLNGFVGFGGGRYQCPGRWFALMEIHLFITLILRMYDLKLVDPVPDLSPLHLVGTQQPVGPSTVEYKHR